MINIEFNEELAKGRIAKRVATILDQSDADSNGLFQRHLLVRRPFLACSDTDQISRIGAGAVRIDKAGIFPYKLGQKTQKSILAKLASEVVVDLSRREIMCLAVATWKERGRLCVPIVKEILETVADTNEFGALPAEGDVQCIPVTRQQDIAISNGLWPDNNHKFCLIETPLQLNGEYFRQINEIGFSLFGRNGVLNGVVNATRHFTGECPTHPISVAFFSKLSGLERRLMSFGSQSVDLARLDLMIDTDGNIKIAEIEAGGKIHGLGFGLFTEQTCAKRNPNVVGVVNGLRKLTGLQEVRLPINMVVSSDFFMEEIKFLAKYLTKNGIACQAIDVSPRNEKRLTQIPEGTLFNLPSGSPSEWQRAWIEGRAKIVLPPRPGLGLKTTLVLLSNINNDPAIENILTRWIDPDKLAIIRAHLPTSKLLSQDEKNRSGNGYIFKTAKDSGAKGITTSPTFSSEIVMERILQKSFNGKFARLAAFLSPNGLVTMPITLSDSEIVHGNSKNIQTSFSIEI
jgi:hypothetical protein